MSRYISYIYDRQNKWAIQKSTIKKDVLYELQNRIKENNKP